MKHISPQQTPGVCSPSLEIQELHRQVESLKQRLGRSESRHRRLCEALPQIVWGADAGGFITYLNRRWYDYTGAAEAESLGFGFLAAVHPEDREKLRLAHSAGFIALSRGALRDPSPGDDEAKTCASGSRTSSTERSRPKEFEFRLRRADGTYRPVAAFAMPITGENGQILEWVGTYDEQNSARPSQNNGEWKKSSSSSIVNSDSCSPEFLCSLLASLADGIVACDALGVVTFCNLAARKLHGLPPSESVSSEWALHKTCTGAAYYLPDGKTPMPTEDIPLVRALNGVSVRDVEMTMVSPQGVRRTLLASAHPILNSQGEKLGAVMAMRDITNCKQAQEALRESEELYRLMAENCTELISRLTPDGIFLYATPASRTLLGYEPDELLGYSIYDFLHPEDAAAIARRDGEACQLRDTYTDSYRIRCKDGNYIWFETRSRYIRHPVLGTDQQIIAVSRDITERKRIESEVCDLNRELDRLVRKQSGQLQAANQLKDQLLAREHLALSAASAAQQQFRLERQRTEESLYFLAQASTLLTASLDYQTTLENLAGLVVPHLADWCAINVMDAQGYCRPRAIAHRDPALEPLVWELQRSYPAEPDGTYGYLKRLRGGETDAPWQISICFDISDANLQNIALDARHLELLRKVSFRSYICLPIRFGRQTFGSILLVRSSFGGLYTQADLTVAEDLTRRGALALEKAQLYTQAKETGENLRRAILVLDEQQRQLRTLAQLTNLLNQRIANLPSLLQVMVRAVCEAIPQAQFCLIVLHDAGRNQLDLMATVGWGTENLPVGQPLETEDGLLRRVFSTGESELICRPIEATCSQDGFTEDGLPPFEAPASVYAVAIGAGGKRPDGVAGGAGGRGFPAPTRRLGVLAIGNWEDSGAFDGETPRQMLEAVAEQAAIAINNARLIKIVEDREELVAVQNHILARQNQELESMSEQIQLQNVQLLEAARLKAQFLSTISHELLTPLNAIMGFSQLLLRSRRQPLTAQQTELMERILNNGRNLDRLIKDILELSKIEAGEESLKMEVFDLIKLVVSTCNELRSQAENKNLALQIDADLANPVTIANDRGRLRQVLVKLLSNAIKFTESGRVQVLVTSDSLRVAIAVSDTGIGIPPDDLNHIFELFRQGNQTTTRKYGGTGLGLAIVNSLVRLMNGTVTVESSVGVGSTFRIQMPRHVSPLS